MFNTISLSLCTLFGHATIRRCLKLFVIKGISLAEKSLNSLVEEYISKCIFFRSNILLHIYTGCIKRSFYAPMTSYFEIHILRQQGCSPPRGFFQLSEEDPINFFCIKWSIADTHKNIACVALPTNPDQLIIHPQAELRHPCCFFTSGQISLLTILPGPS